MTHYQKMPYWYVLLRHFENKGYIYNGLTIPFLIGARERLEPKEKKLAIKELMVSINKFGGTILKCPNVREFIIGTMDSETLKYKSIYPKTIENIIVTDNSLSMVNSLEELIAHFEHRYQKNVDNAEYSKNYGTWGYFEQTELARIDEINSP